MQSAVPSGCGLKYPALVQQGSFMKDTTTYIILNMDPTTTLIQNIHPTHILPKENTQNPMSDRPIISTATYNHHHKTIQRLVNKHWTRFQSIQKGNPELSRNITMCYRRNPSLRNKLAKTRYIQELATPTNRPILKPHCTNKCWSRKMPHIPRYQFLSITLGTTHTTKCNYTCRSSGIVYLVTC